MNCCNDFGDCRQGRDCPVRQQRAEDALRAEDSKTSYFSWISDPGLGMLVLIGCGSAVVSLIALFVTWVSNS